VNCFDYASPGSTVVEHLHGKQAVVGSIPTLGKLRLPTVGCFQLVSRIRFRKEDCKNGKRSF
jgi:hypothetical protein